MRFIDEFVQIIKYCKYIHFSYTYLQIKMSRNTMQANTQKHLFYNVDTYTH